MRDLIAISGKQFSGKDLLADLLVEALPRYKKTPIAKGIKTEFAALYNLTPHEVENQKAMYRPALIAIGQRRREQDPNYWLKQVINISGPKIISDIRLKQEYDYFKTMGALMIRLDADRQIRKQRGTLVAEDDPTECELDDIQDWDMILTNNDSLDVLRQQVHELISRLT